MKPVSCTLICSLIVLVLPFTRQNELIDWIESKGGWVRNLLLTCQQLMDCLVLDNYID